MLVVRNLNAYYGEVHVIKNLSLHVGKGEIVAILGANGAGKSTLMNTIAGLIIPRSGEILVDGASIAGLSPGEIISMGISLVPEGKALFYGLTVRENLALGLAHMGLRMTARVRSMIDEAIDVFPSLGSKSDIIAGNLSGGEQQMLSIARALVSRPRILLLDELSMGLAPNTTALIFSRIKEVNKSFDTSILVVEQNARLALDISSRGYIMETGKVIFKGKSADLRNNPEVLRSYLGGAGGRDDLR